MSDINNLIGRVTIYESIAKSYKGVDYFLVRDGDGWFWDLEDGTATTTIRETAQGSAESDVKEYIRRSLR